MLLKSSPGWKFSCIKYTVILNYSHNENKNNLFTEI